MHSAGARHTTDDHVERNDAIVLVVVHFCLNLAAVDDDDILGRGPSL